MGGFEIGRVFTRTGQLLAAGAASVGLFVLAAQAVGVALQYLTSTQLMATVAAAQKAGTTLGPAALFGSPWYWLSMVVNLLVASASYAGSVAGFTTLAGGRPTSFADCLAAGLRLMLPTLALMILWGLAIGAASMLLVVPGLFLLTMWSVALPALVIEGSGVIGAFGRSRALTKGARWPIFAVLVIFVIVIYIVTAAFGLVTVGLGGMGAMAGGFGAPQPFSLLLVGASLVLAWIAAMGIGAFLSSLYVEVAGQRTGFAAGAVAEVFG